MTVRFTKLYTVRGFVRVLILCNCDTVLFQYMEGLSFYCPSHNSTPVVPNVLVSEQVIHEKELPRHPTLALAMRAVMV